jgi:DNA-binding NarL/FixJ family response regulator
MAAMGESENRGTFTTLTERERTIIRVLLAEGAPGKVAEHLGLSDRHTRRLLKAFAERVGVTNTHALVAWAVHHGLVDADETHF